MHYYRSREKPVAFLCPPHSTVDCVNFFVAVCFLRRFVRGRLCRSSTISVRTEGWQIISWAWWAPREIYIKELGPFEWLGKEAAPLNITHLFLHWTISILCIFFFLKSYCFPAAMFPEGTFVVDHLGSPDIGNASAYEPWRSYIQALALRSNVYVKVSGALSEAAHGKYGNW